MQLYVCTVVPSSDLRNDENILKLIDSVGTFALKVWQKVGVDMEMAGAERKDQGRDEFIGICQRNTTHHTRTYITLHTLHYSTLNNSNLTLVDAYKKT